MNPKTFHILFMVLATIVTISSFWLAGEILLQKPTNLFFGLAMLVIGGIFLFVDFFLVYMWLDHWSKCNGRL